MILVTFAGRSVGSMGCGDLTGAARRRRSRDYVEIDTLTWERKLVDVVDAEFEGAVLFAGLMDWFDDEDALVAGRARGSAW